MCEAPSIAWILENRPWFEGRNVVGHADVASKVSFDVLEEFTKVPYRRIPPPSGSQLEQLAAPLGQAFGEVGGTDGRCWMISPVSSRTFRSDDRPVMPVLS